MERIWAKLVRSCGLLLECLDGHGDEVVQVHGVLPEFLLVIEFDQLVPMGGLGREGWLVPEGTVEAVPLQEIMDL